MIKRTDDALELIFLSHARTFAPSIEWDQPPLVEDQLWRMNLHYMEYLEQVSSADAFDLIAQWIVANPPYRRGYWRDAWNSYSVSLRVVVWMQTIERHATAPQPVVDSIARQLFFLERNLERDIGGNHLIKNIKALAWGSAFFAGPVATRWRALAVRLLRQELPHQILPDGMHYERSPSYHCQVFADLVEVRHALGRDPLGGALDETLARMAAATTVLAHPDGFTAEFNDSGLTMAYTPTECLAAYAAVFGHRVAVRDGPFALPQAGYFGFRRDADYLIVDMGRIGPDDLPAHAHADIGSIELSIRGTRIIIDQGVYEYTASARRKASRSAHYHNCLAIEGAEPADFYGAFRCGRRPRVGVSQFLVGEDGFLVEGHHDGYRRLKGRPVVVRRVQANAGRIVLHDRVNGSHWHKATSRLLLHPDCQIELHGDLAIVRRGEVSITIKGSARLYVEPAVWWPDMGVEIATRRLCLTLPPGCFEATLEFGALVPAESEFA